MYVNEFSMCFMEGLCNICVTNTVVTDNGCLYIFNVASSFCLFDSFFGQMLMHSNMGESFSK